MDADKKLNLGEGVPLNSTPAANIFLNTGTKKINEGTVIHLKTEKPADVGVHINTTLSIASSKKIKLLLIFNFMFTIICMMISCAIAIYFWNELISIKKHMDLLKEQIPVKNVSESVQEKPIHSQLIYNLRPQVNGAEAREGRMDFHKDELSSNARKYYVEDLGEDMLLVDSSKKNPSRHKETMYDTSVFQKEPLVVQFNGAMQELNIGTKSIIGPWVRDMEVSSKNSETKIELDMDFFTIKESGLYLIYAQIVYLTHSPNCYFVWARQPSQEPRLITSCATGDDSSNRPLGKSQMSCSVQTIARLYKSDTVNVSQREQNRTLWLRPGYTYFGFVKISS